MAARSVRLSTEGGSQSRGELNTASATIWYTVVTDPGDPPHVAEAAVGIAYGTPLAGDSRNRRASAINANLESGSNNVYRVGVDYSDQGGDVALNPLERIFRPTLDFEESREPTFIDGNGIQIVNSAGLSFDPPFEITVTDPVITIPVNIPTWTFSIWLAGNNSVNTQPFAGAAAGELKASVTVSPQEENGVNYYQAVWRLVGRPNRTISKKLIYGWDTLILDEGRYAFTSAADGTLIPILDDNDEPVVDPVPMNGAGYALTDYPADAGNPLFLVSNDNKAVFRIVHPIKSTDFNALGIRYKL